MAVSILVSEFRINESTAFCDSVNGRSFANGKGWPGWENRRRSAPAPMALPMALASADFSQLRQGSICLGFCLGLPQPHCHRVTFNFATSLRHWAAAS